MSLSCEATESGDGSSATLASPYTVVIGHEAKRNTSHKTNGEIPQMADALARRLC